MDRFFECEDCGKQYPAPRFVEEHQRKHCIGTKRSFHAILEGAKEVWQGRKRRRTMTGVTSRPWSTTRLTPNVPPGGGSVEGVQVELEQTRQPGSVSVSDPSRPSGNVKLTYSILLQEGTTSYVSWLRAMHLRDPRVEGQLPNGVAALGGSISSSPDPQTEPLLATLVPSESPQGHAVGSNAAPNVATLLPPGTWGSISITNTLGLHRFFYWRTTISRDPEAYRCSVNQTFEGASSTTVPFVLVNL
jgi:hypothetical protein